MTTMMTRRPLLLGLAAAGLGGAAAPAQGQMQVTLLGTASPQPNPNRFGPCTLVQANGLNLVFDAGRGCTIRLDQVGVPLGRVDATFLTHFHSDHVNGLPDLWMTSYIQTPYGDRRTPFRLYGPTGTVRLATSMRETFKDDIAIRMADEGIPEVRTRIEAHEFPEAGGVVFEERGVRVTAFAVDHGRLIHPSVGYRVDYAGRSVVLSGDTRFSPNLIAHARGVDLLIHEVFVMPPQAVRDPTAVVVQEHHTTPEQAGEVFNQVRPKLAVYSHIVQLRRAGMKPPTIADVLSRTRKVYKGPLVAGEDLTRYTLTAAGVTGERLSNTARPG
jgi:ribonuclease Z